MHRYSLGLLNHAAGAKSSSNSPGHPQAESETEPQAPQTLQEPLLRRLNGRPQACDPCRGRKVACDNAQPVCARCRKRKQAARCVYTISEQTSRPSRRPQRGGQAVAESSITPSRSEHRRVSLDGDAFTNSPIVRRNRVVNDGTNTVLPAGTTPLPPPGNAYLGFFSYSTVFDEARTSLTLLNGAQRFATTSDIAPSIRCATRRAPRPGDISSNLGGVNREMCLHVLRSLPDPTVETLKPLGVHAAQLWGRIAAGRILKTLHVRYGAELTRSPRDDARLEIIAEEICANTSKPFDSDLADPAAFMDQFAGDHLRWESLGLVFVFRELSPDVNGSGAVPPPEDLGRVWDVWPESGRACLKICIELAKSFSDGNSILMALYCRLIVVDSLVFGDASLTDWVSHGEAVALATCMGLHALPDPADYKPTLASELKRRHFAFIFNIDKVGASFHGRPPMLGHRYTSSPWPLSLPDEALLAGGDELEHAITFLDKDGWNTMETLGTTTVLKCRVMINIIKDELIEIALGSSKHASLAVIQDIKEREQRVHDSFPSKCKYTDEHLDELHLSVETLFCRLLIHLEHLQSRLFAERLIARLNGPDDGSLLFVSFEIVRHVLIFWMHMDRFEGIRVDFLWLVMSYGSPGGGVLCMELLYPTLPNRPIPYTNSSSPRITRSAIIQQLSLLVGFLGWAGPTAPTAEQSANCKAVIQSVLDHTLNGPSGPAPHSADGGLQNLFEGFDAGQLDFGFDLLGTFDWFRPEEAMPGFT